MNCYKHDNILAVGVCLGCGRAVCAECVQTGGSRKLACSTECESAIFANDAAVDAILKKSINSSRITGWFSCSNSDLI